MTAPPDLQTRGSKLWDDLGADRLDAGRAGMVHEAGRLLDRCDRLHELLSGREDAWLTLIAPDSGEVSLVVDKLLDTARQYSLAFVTIMEKLRAAGVTGDSGEDEGPNLIDEIQRKRAEREQQRTTSA